MCVVNDTGFQVLRVADIDKRAESISRASQTIVDDFAAHATVSLSSRPKHISLSGDSSTVSVCFKDQQTNVIHLYDIQSFKAPVWLRKIFSFLTTIILGTCVLVLAERMSSSGCLSIRKDIRPQNLHQLTVMECTFPPLLFL